jgi:Na+/proline symporter
MVFAFYQFVAPPLWFNPVEAKQAAEGPRGAEMAALQSAHRAAQSERRTEALKLVAAGKSGDESALAAAKASLRAAHAKAEAVKTRAAALVKETVPKSEGKDTNYVFLRFVLDVLPSGIVGLVLAAIFAASMSSTSAELNALSTTSVVDVYRRLLGRDASEEKLVKISKGLTVVWGVFAIAFAQYASRLGTLVEAVNILGSFFYGTILGVFLTAFYLPRVKGGASFWGAIAGEAAVVACFAFTDVSFLWLNALGCIVVVLVALAVSIVTERGRGGGGVAALLPEGRRTPADS